MSFRGIPADNDVRYTNAEKKLLQNTKFPAIFQTKVDTTKVNLQVLRIWINKRITELLGIEDEVVVELVHSLMEERFPDPKKCQITLTGFLEKSAPKFMQEFWEMLISAQESVGGIPASLVEAKKAELRERRIEESQITRNLDKTMNRSRSPQRRFDQGQQQSRDDYERPLRMRDPQQYSTRRNDGPPPQGRPDRRSENLRGPDGRNRRRGDDYSRSEMTNRPGHHKAHDRRPSVDVIINSDRSHTRSGRLSPVMHQDRSTRGSRRTSDIPTPPRKSSPSSHVRSRETRDSYRRSRSRSPTRGESVDSIGRRKRTRNDSSSGSIRQRSRTRRTSSPRERRSHKSGHRSHSRDRETSRGRSSRHSRHSRQSKSRSYRRLRSRSPARSDFSSRSSSRSRSRSRSRGTRHRRSRRDDESKHHHSSRRSERRRRHRSPSSPSSISSSRSPPRSRTRRRRREHHSSDPSRSSSPARRRDRSSSAPIERGRTRYSPEKNISAPPVDEEAQHRENVLKAKLQRQKRMAEAKTKALEEPAITDTPNAVTVANDQAEDDESRNGTENAS